MKRIFDPIHHFIELDAAEIALLDTAPMQRLRRLRQLGLAYLAFPGAEHSRFSHALGALATGERILQSLRGHSADYFTNERDFQYQRRLLRASLLLHDIGHGPFSHASETVLGVHHEERTRALLGLPAMRRALAALDLDCDDVAGLVTGGGAARRPVLKEIVSGPNLDADRMDYLLRDAHFTGVVSGRYDQAQMIASLRVYESAGEPVLGVDGRGATALESFVVARYMMFSTVYFHHTTRAYERILGEALAEIWPDPRQLGEPAAFLEWDDFRVIDAFRTALGDAARAVRQRETYLGLAAEFNAERDLRVYEACRTALQERYGDAVWADQQEQLLHRLPVGIDSGATVLVGTRTGVRDAREVSDVISKLTGKSYWRKLFVDRRRADLNAAREICARVMNA